MIIKSAKFVVSQSDSKMCKDYNCPEIAIVGKSNVGKSSFINMVTSSSKLAKTSSTPGRTRLINYFEINGGEFMFVDLPGYGFAKVTDEEKVKWGSMIEGYLANKFGRIVNVLVLIDIRRTPDKLDKQMVTYLHYYNLPFTIIATKADKLSRMQQQKQKQIIANELGVGRDNIIITSCLDKVGIKETLDRIEVILDANKAENLPSEDEENQ